MKQNVQSDLNHWRKQIDAVDDQIITLLAMRMDIVQQVGTYKKANNIAARDENRWQSLLDALIKKGRKKKLSKELITQIYTAIHEYSVDKQKVILSEVEEPAPACRTDRCRQTGLIPPKIGL